MMIIYFFAQSIILSTLTKEENGLLFTERRIADLLLIFLVDFGLSSVVMRRMIQFPDRAKSILSSAVVYRFLLWIPATAISIGYAAVAGYSILDVSIWCGFLLISSRTGLLRYLYELPYRSKVRFGIPAIVTILDAVLFLSLIYLWSDSLTPTRVIIAFAVTAIPGFLVILLLDRGRYVNLRFFNRGELKMIIKEALPVLIAIIFMHVHDKIDALMLAWYSPASEVGIFGAAYITLAPLIGTFPMALAMAVVPVISRLAKEDWQESVKYAFTGLRFLTTLGIVICSAVSTLAPFIIQLVSKGRYADNVLHFYVFLWTPVPIFLLVYIQELNVAFSKQKLNIPITATLAGLTIVGGLILIPELDALGAIFTKLASVSIAGIVAVWVFRAILKQGIDLQYVLGTLLTLVTGVATSIGLAKLMPMWPAAMTSALLTLVAAFLFRLIQMKDLHMIRRIVQQKNG